MLDVKKREYYVYKTDSVYVPCKYPFKSQCLIHVNLVECEAAEALGFDGQEKQRSKHMQEVSVHVQNLSSVLGSLNPRDLKPSQLRVTMADLNQAMESIKMAAVPGAGPSSGVRGSGHIPHHLVDDDDDEEDIVISK